ncbi:MAG: hypothetical protein JXR05_04415 [Flavobacteriaceae bacterium]
MRKIVCFLIFLLSYSVNAQTLSEKKIDKLNGLSINTDRLNLNDITIQKSLNEILKLDRKRKTNKTLGIVFTSISAIGIITGLLMVSSGNTLEGGHDFATPIGGIMIAGGVAYGGISIPFWISSNKRKKERDKLMKLFDE